MMKKSDHTGDAKVCLDDQDSAEFFSRLEAMLKEDRTKGSVGEESLTSISQAELLDSEHLFDKYMRSIADSVAVEQGPLLVGWRDCQVYTDSHGFKAVNTPLSMALWARRKHHRPVGLISPTYGHVLTETAERLSTGEIWDMSEMAVFVNVIDAMAWLTKHAKTGCKYCDRDADLQSMPPLFDSMRHTRISSKKVTVGEEYMARRIIDLLRLPGNRGKTHDAVVHRSMLGSLVRELCRLDGEAAQADLTRNEYISRLANQSSIRSFISKDRQKELQMIAEIMCKHNPAAAQEIQPLISQTSGMSMDSFMRDDDLKMSNLLDLGYLLKLTADNRRLLSECKTKNCMATIPVREV